MAKNSCENKLLDCSSKFLDDIFELCRNLRKSGVEGVPVMQLVRAGTSVGANISEAQYAHGRKDFISKIEIAAKECKECAHWLGLLHRAGNIPDGVYSSLSSQRINIQRMIAYSARTAKKNLEEAKTKKADGAGAPLP